MRLNARYMQKDDFHYVVRNYLGDYIPMVTIVDTELGTAECTMCEITEVDGKKQYKIIHSYDPNDSMDEGTIHEYTLHSFELWDTATNELVAKV